MPSESLSRLRQITRAAAGWHCMHVFNLGDSTLMTSRLGMPWITKLCGGRLVKFWSYLMLCFGIVCSASAQFAGAAPGSPSGGDDALLQSLLHARPPELSFHPDDVLAVRIYGVPEYNIEQRVARDGTIAFPLVGKVKVAGLTVQQLEATLASLLAKNGMIKAPQVTVRAVSQPWVVVTVSGDVPKAGIFPAYGELTLIDYLSEAGGLSGNLSNSSISNSPASSIVTLIRPALGKPVQIPVGTDPGKSQYARIPLFPGDQILVGKVGVVYAVGALKSQGAFPLKNDSRTSVLQLVALSGGIGYEGDKKHSYIIRERDHKRYALEVNITKILKGQMADISLQANDILFVPTNSMKAAIKGGGSAAVVSLAAAYLYSHP